MIHARRYESGVTLIQIVIGLVIIGIVAGFALMNASSKKATIAKSEIAQLDKYKTAVADFKEKYSYLPGDIPAALVMQLKFVKRDGTPGRGDGNGQLEGYDYVNSKVADAFQSGEPLFFWEDLFSADMTKEPFNTAADSELPNEVNSLNIAEYLPDAKIGGGNRLYAYGDGKANYIGISAVSKIEVTGTLTSKPGLTAKQAQEVDTKIDDGAPSTGKVVARYIDTQVQSAPAAQAASCYDAASNHYAVAQAGQNCGLSFAME